MKIFFKGRNRICPCCKSYRFEEEGKYEICPICKWEDDPKQKRDPEFAGGANKLSLIEYRRMYKEKQREENI